MKKTILAKTIFVNMVILFVVVISACGGQSQPSAPVAGETPSPTVISSPTTIPSPTLTPTPFAPVNIGTPLPESLLVPITVDNVAKIREVGIYGEVKKGKLLTSEGKYLLLEKPDGGNVIETKSQKLIAELKYKTLLDVSSDGSQFLVIDSDGVAILNTNGERIAIPSMGNYEIESGALSVAQKWVAILACDTSSNCKINIISIDSKEVVKIMPWKRSALKFSEEGKYLATWRGGNPVLRTSDWKQVLSFEGGWSIFSPDEKYVATATCSGHDIKIIVYDLEKSKAKLDTLLNNIDCYGADAPKDVIFTANSQKVALLSGKTVYVWNIEDGSLINSMETDLKNFDLARIMDDGKIWAAPGIQPAPWEFDFNGYPLINDVAFSPDGKEILTAYGNNQTVQTQTCIINIQKSVACSSRLGDPFYFQPWTDWTILGSDGQFYQITRVEEEFTIRKGADGSGEVVGMIKSKSLVPPELFVPSQPFMLFGSDDGLMMTNFNETKMWLQSDSSKMPFQFINEGSVYSVSADNKVLAFRDLIDNKDPDNKIHIVNMHTLESTAVISSAFDNRADISISRFTLSPDGSQLALVTSFVDTTNKEVTGQKITMFDTLTGDELYSKDLQVEPRPYAGIDPVQDIKFSPDGSLLILASPNGSTFINAESGVVINNIADMIGYDVAFSPDGKLIALNGYLEGILLWGIQP